MSIKQKSKVGKRYGHLKVLELTGRKDSRHAEFYKCRCDCGNIVEVRGDNLVTGNSTRCAQCAGRTPRNILQYADEGRHYR